MSTATTPAMATSFLARREYSTTPLLRLRLLSWPPRPGPVFHPEALVSRRAFRNLPGELRHLLEPERPGAARPRRRSERLGWSLHLGPPRVRLGAAGGRSLDGVGGNRHVH